MVQTGGRDRATRRVAVLVALIAACAIGCGKKDGADQQKADTDTTAAVPSVAQAGAALAESADVALGAAAEEERRENVVARGLDKGDDPPKEGGGTGGGGPDGTGRPTPGLPKRIEQMNDTELVNYLNSLIYDVHPSNMHKVKRKCRGGPNQCADVTIYPEQGMRHVAHTDLAPNGRVVARFFNFHFTQMEDRLGIPPRKRAYWLVDRDPSTGRPRSRFFVRTYVFNAPVRFLQPANSPGHPSNVWNQCPAHPNEPKGTYAKAKFRFCGKVPSLSAAEGDTLGIRSQHDSPPWVTCAQGCCLAGLALESSAESAAPTANDSARAQKR